MKLVFKYLDGIDKKYQYALFVFALLALLSSTIANKNYLIAKGDEGLGFNQPKQDAEWGIPSLIPYSYNTLDKNNRSVGPFSKQNVPDLYHRHWLGTDSLGRDVLAGILEGFAIALKIGLGTMILSFIVGLLFSFLSGYYGDTVFRINRIDFFIWLTLSCLSLFYAVYSSGIISLMLFIIPLVGLIILYLYRRIDYKSSIKIPWDTMVMKLIELLNSMPAIFLILVFLSLFRVPSIWNVILIIVILRWPTICRHLRAEIMAIKSEEYILSARAIGLNDWQIFSRHILPNAISPVFTVLAFGFSAAILTESTLSFLGIGLPVEQVSWGSMIKEARTDLSAWWLALFPGLMIYMTLRIFNGIGTNLNKLIKYA